jgi:predicted esterase
VEYGPLGGVIGLNGLQPIEIDHSDIPHHQIELIGQTPLFLYHGLNDEKVSLEKA